MTQRAASSAPSVSSLEVKTQPENRCYVNQQVNVDVIFIVWKQIDESNVRFWKEKSSCLNGCNEMFVFCFLNRPSGPGGAVEGGGAAGAAAGGSEDLLPQAAAQHAPHVPQGPHEDH